MKTLLELEPNDCRFAFGETDFRFCAQPQHVYLRNDKMVQSPYCKEHHFICTKVREVTPA